MSLFFRSHRWWYAQVAVSGTTAGARRSGRGAVAPGRARAAYLVLPARGRPRGFAAGPVRATTTPPACRWRRLIIEATGRRYVVYYCMSNPFSLIGALRHTVAVF